MLKLVVFLAYIKGRDFYHVLERLDYFLKLRICGTVETLIMVPHKASRAVRYGGIIVVL